MLPIIYYAGISIARAWDQPIMLIFNLLCYAQVLKFSTYYAHVRDLC